MARRYGVFLNEAVGIHSIHRGKHGDAFDVVAAKFHVVHGNVVARGMGEKERAVEIESEPIIKACMAKRSATSK